MCKDKRQTQNTSQGKTISICNRYHISVVPYSISFFIPTFILTYRCIVFVLESKSNCNDANYESLLKRTSKAVLLKHPEASTTTLKGTSKHNIVWHFRNNKMMHLSTNIYSFTFGCGLTGSFNCYVVTILFKSNLFCIKIIKPTYYLEKYVEYGYLLVISMHLNSNFFWLEHICYRQP